MFVELHMLQNFAPSNLNRDDTGAPKDCDFGGVHRARISSQCLKRATRKAFEERQLLRAEDLAVRTRQLVEVELVPRLTQAGRDGAEARAVVEEMLRSVKIQLKGNNTQYLLFVGRREIDRLEAVCQEHWDELVTVIGGAKKAKKDVASKVVGDAVRKSLDGGRAADLALFGRMIADATSLSRDAASQVAHAISTHEVQTKFDYYTAVDDLQEKSRASGEEDDAGAGAGMLGTIEFNSACYYRYSNVDSDQLLKNLSGDTELARATIRAFLQASVTAIPTGKQNSMAALNLPSLVLVVVRERGLQNLANAFVQPARPGDEGNLVGHSVQKLTEHRAALALMYGAESERGAWFATTEDGVADGLGERAESVAQVIERAVEAVQFGAA